MKQFRIEATLALGAKLCVSKTAKHAPLKLAREIRDKLGATSVSVLVFSERSQIWFGVYEARQ